jgi:phage gp36-like protein
MPAPLSDSGLIDQVLGRHHLNQRTLSAILNVRECAISRWRAGLQRMTPDHRASLVYLATPPRGRESR